MLGFFAKRWRAGSTRLLSVVCGGCLMSALVAQMSAWAAEAPAVRLFSDGQAVCVVVVPEGSMAWEGDDRVLREAWAPWEDEPERLRRLQRDSTKDLADHLIAKLDENYQPSISLNPGDYVVPTEDPEERKFDPEPRVWDAAAGRWSVSDRLMLLANRVAERVGENYPDVLFNLNAYVTDTLQPGENQLNLLAERIRLWELGTGGLMGPVVFFQEK